MVLIHAALSGGAMASGVRAFPAEPPLPNKPIKSTVVDYKVPPFPLPPVPTASPPSTMPYANVDLRNENGFIPASVISSSKVDIEKENQKLQAKENLEFAYDSPPMEAPSRTRVAGADGTMELRKDSTNPYCNFCVAYMRSKFGGGAAGEAVCKKQFPSRSLGACTTIMKQLETQVNAGTVADLKGCIDRTGPMAIVKDGVKSTCPPIVACNLIKAGNGSPMCGTVYNSWGMFKLPKQPHPDPEKNADPAPFAPPPSTYSGSGNPYCEMCELYINAGGKAGVTTSEEAFCTKNMATSQVTSCMSVIRQLKSNSLAEKMVSKGCVDLTGEKEETKTPCPGILACNLISDDSRGPMCGSALGQWVADVGEKTYHKFRPPPTTGEGKPAASQ